jgi:hypothetical protein
LPLRIWEKISGIDKWIDAPAQVVESRVRDLDILGGPTSRKSGPIYSESFIRITWTDQRGVTHSGELEAPEESPLYQLIEGDTVQIRFNPATPDEFKVRGLARDQAASAAKKVIFAIVVGVVVILVWFGPDLLIIFSK